MIKEGVKSPITLSTHTRLVKKIETGVIISAYQKYLRIDVSRFFNEKQISLYRCEDTGYEFYHPPTIAGDGKFYEELQKIDWYYQDWKYEYEISKRYLTPGQSLLEIGCGRGAFLKFAKNEGLNVTGLELNEDAVAGATTNNLTVLNETIESHSIKNENKYDCIVCFQVLEHISDIHGFMTAAMKTLKKDGRFIIAVPNNDAYFFSYTKTVIHNEFQQQLALIMNMPPHHMGRWTKVAFKKTGNFFGLKIEASFKEPIQPHRAVIVSEILAHKFLSGFPSKYTASITKVFNRIIQKFHAKFAGDTLLIVYKKLK